MTPEAIEQLRLTFSQLIDEIKLQHVNLMPGRSWPPSLSAQATSHPRELIDLLGQVEIYITNCIADYLQRSLAFDLPLNQGTQQIAIKRVVELDKHLNHLHQLFDEHIEAMIADEPDTAIRENIVRIIRYFSVEEDIPMDENWDLSEIARARVLVHCYRACRFGLTPKKLMLELSAALSDEKSIKLYSSKSQAEPPLAIEPKGEYREDSHAVQSSTGESGVARTAGLWLFNQALAQAGVADQISYEQRDILNNLRKGPGAQSRLLLAVPLTERENMNYVASPRAHRLGLQLACDRLFSGSIFIRRDRQPGYSSYHLTMMHELVHALHIAQGLSAAKITGIVTNQYWQSTDTIGFEFATEEFKTTVFDDLSEYTMADDMQVNVKRLPYIVFLLPLGKLQAYDGRWEQVPGMQEPLGDYMAANKLLPAARRACNIM